MRRAYQLLSPRLAPRLALAAALLFAGLVAPAQAGFVSGSFKINIAESSRVLDAMLKEERGQYTHEQFNAIKMEEMWKSPNTRLVDRNRPAIMLQNTSDSATNNEIAQFTIDIQELGYAFGTGDFNPDPFAGNFTFLTKNSDSGVTVTSSLAPTSDTDSTPDPTKLLLNFSGLTPGKAVIFRVDLDPAPMTTAAFPDYQCILLGATDDPSDPTDPALITALFASGTGENRMTTATTPVAFNQADGDIVTGAGLLEAYHFQSASNFYTQTGGTEIPEPSTLLLLLAGVASLTRRSRGCR